MHFAYLLGRAELAGSPELSIGQTQFYRGRWSGALFAYPDYADIKAVSSTWLAAGGGYFSRCVAILCNLAKRRACVILR